ARAEVLAGGSEDDHEATGHVLAAVIADTFDDRDRAGIAHAEAFARASSCEQVAAGGAVEHGVADDGLVLPDERLGGVRTDDDLTAVHALANVVIGLAIQRETDAVDQERAERLASGATEREVNGSRR